jgi:importin-7
MAAEETGGQNVDLDNIMEADTDDDKTYAAMGVTKTIGTVSTESKGMIIES